jgi:endoglucanase
MDDQSLTFLKTLVETPSPSGFERPIQDVVRNWAGPIADDVRTDRHGNVIAARFPTGGANAGQLKVMLAGHCDQIGLMIEHIDDHGYLYVQPIGGWDMQILLGQHLTVLSRNGPLPGVVARRATHLLTNEERAKVPQFSDIWVDIGAKDRADAETMVRLGDPIVSRPGYVPMPNNLAASPSMDDKVGVWVVFEALRRLQGRALNVAVYAVSTVQEEIGLRGATTSAYGIHPHIGIAVDVCHATDTPGNDKKIVGDTRLGAGPVVFRGPNINPRVFERLEETAGRTEVPVQVRGVPRGTGTDANAIQISRDGVATALVGIPNRYMHSPVEMVSLTDLDRAATLLAEFCAGLTADVDLTP